MNTRLNGKEPLTITNPELAKEWDYDKNAPLTPNDVTAGSNKIVWWVGTCGHEWSAVIGSRSSGRKCPYCSGRLVLPGFNDLATTNPELLEEWAYEKNNQIQPNKISSGSHQKVWWKCSACGNEWCASISKRSNGRGCPIRSAKHGAQKATKTRIQSNGSLSENNPELLSEWNYEKNSGISPNTVLSGSNMKVWWICAKGHEWQAVIHSRTGKAKHGCPVCNHRKGGAKIMKRVLNTDTGESYQSVKQAAESNNLSSSSIVNACKGLSKTAGGYHWKYEDK